MADQSVEKIQSFLAILGNVSSVLAEIKCKEFNGHKPGYAGYHLQKIKDNALMIYKALSKEGWEEAKRSVPAVSLTDDNHVVKLVGEGQVFMTLTIRDNDVSIEAGKTVYKFSMPFVSKAQ